MMKISRRDARGGGRGEGEDATLRVRPMAYLGNPLWGPNRARHTHTPHFGVRTCAARVRDRIFFPFFAILGALGAPRGIVSHNRHSRDTVRPEVEKTPLLGGPK